MSPLMVGFDLDMTLVDSRPGIAAAFRALTARTGVHVDGELAVSRLGPPLRTELAHWFPPERVEEAVTLYRELYPAYAITPTVPMPGAEAALRAVQARGGRTMVVTAKMGRLAKLHLDHLGLPVDELAGDVFAEQKAVALREHGATLYVGDHVADMAAARAAGIPGVAVATGPCSADELTEAGAYLVLDDLVEFPRALDRIIGLALEG
ncbi:haloacid dehalogenase-like hydrolase [Micromonospora aurantiaca]|uniref:HAD family hydrolase n=1 Tax=Micromonospora aurantiaca (nom. illeg.) TaxID=47850 RepID=A0A1C6T8V1_9ACTN|nr:MULTISPECIES: haloacid dehalogenase-like hydrolase [Micromonospora]ADL44065.1 Haloacid dehalogenase domain protein hydrolase [Micromonospora aurantiaca ATCC 27029]AXH90301.1 HAD family hydrolase [Micromonospora aurantiaca]KAB1110958.1 HAD hydrolase-like protein [Micromonospora aurantiaca]MBC9001378.1 HAD hydrolase-like protein [Micromonospora aurantiaca]MDG4755519.1 haloacid dehalogenase-like hydrolase [Micromonospora sp. WMMD718]